MVKNMASTTTAESATDGPCLMAEARKYIRPRKSERALGALFWAAIWISFFTGGTPLIVLLIVATFSAIALTYLSWMRSRALKRHLRRMR